MTLLIEELSHVSVSTKRFVSKESIKLAKISRFGSTLLMLVKSNEK